MFDLPASDDRENKGGLVHSVRDSNWSRVLINVLYSDVGMVRFGKRLNAPAVICFAPTCSATFCSAAHIFFSDSLRSHSSMKLRPFSPDALRASSSASVRIWPPASTFHGVRAMPIRIQGQENHLCAVSVGLGSKGGEEEMDDDYRTFVTAHRKNLAFNVTFDDGVSGLVGHEGCFPSVLGVFVGLDHEPSRRVRNTLRGRGFLMS